MADPKDTILPPAKYFNLMRVSHSAREFFFELAQAGQAPGIASLVERVVTSPAHAKAMLKAMAENILKYEQQFGEIPEDEPAKTEKEIQ